MNINRPDLNLLAVFHAVAETQSVSKAAARLNLSQPAVSHALNRLRHQTGDPLFVRSGRNLVLTPHADRMRGDARTLVAAAQNLLAPAAFNPHTGVRRFRIGSSDYSSLTLMPALARHLRQHAPNCVLEVQQAGAQTLAQLETGALDCSFWGAAPPAAPWAWQHLFEEKLIAAAARTHKLSRKARQEAITLEDYLAYPHAVVSLRDPGINPVGRELERLGVKRTVTLTGQSFAGNLAALPGSDLIMSLPSRLAGYAESQGLATFPLPLNLPAYAYSLVWHTRTEADAAMIWLRGVIAGLAGAVE